jgi:hypothetical protein
LSTYPRPSRVMFERPIRMVDEAVIEPVRHSVPPLGV